GFLTIRVKWKQAPRVDRPWCGWFWCVVSFSGVELGEPGHWTELVKRSKGARGMPRRGQAKKDVASCDKPWGGARILLSRGVRIRQPGGCHVPSILRVSQRRRSK